MLGSLAQRGLIVLPDQGALRRLATIVALDVAGYSARVEADEAATAAEVSELADHVAKAAAEYGGRVFNTAGDGFMLEFPTVSGALEAAEAVTLGGVLPVRAGVHLGEVIVTPGGDLLGHGVNVAARIQAFALLGDPQDVFAAIDAQAGDADDYIFYAFFTPVSASLRGDPRFWPLMARHGLAAYWLKSGRWPDFCDAGSAACRAKAEVALREAR